MSAVNDLGNSVSDDHYFSENRRTRSENIFGDNYNSMTGSGKAYFLGLIRMNSLKFLRFIVFLELVYMI